MPQGHGAAPAPPAGSCGCPRAQCWRTRGQLQLPLCMALASPGVAAVAPAQGAGEPRDGGPVRGG